MKDKFIAIDLDGTLLKKPKFNFTENDKRMVRKAQAQDYKVGVASGRAIVETNELEKRESIKFDFIIGLNGMESTFSTEERSLDKKIIGILLENGIHFEIQDGVRRIFTDDFHHKIGVLLGTEALQVDSQDELLTFNAKKLVIRSINNTLSIKKMSQIIEACEEYDFFVVNDYSIEIVNKGINKKACFYNDSNIHSYVASIGDSYNDIELLSHSNNGYLMNNASEELKEKYRDEFILINSVSDAIKLELLEIKGVIFDLDGVITDTAKYHFYAWRDTVADYGLTLTEDLNEHLKGVSREDSLEIILNENRSKLAKSKKDEILQSKNNRYLELIRDMNESDLLEGIKPLLKKLNNLNIKMAIASASKNALFILDALNITRYFDVIVDVTKIKNGKPDPEIFDSAIKQLNLKEYEVVAIEDSIAGIKAINALDVVSIGIGRVLSESTIILDSTKGLIDLEWEKQ